MDKIKLFRDTVKQNKNKLIEAGFKPTTVSSWMYSDKIPSLENAAKLSMLLEMKLSEIPYYRTERVI